MKYKLISLFFLYTTTLYAQPYIDLVTIRYIKSPDAGLIRRNFQHNKYDYLHAGINIPMISKKDSSTLLFSPFFEKWSISVDNVDYIPETLQGLAFPVTYIKPFSEKWSAAFSAIPRWNGNSGNFFDNSFQFGGIMLATYRKQSNLKYKAGLYFNSEFSGPFVMPLVGIDWRPNSKNILFGVLPGSMTWEHKVTKRFYYGAIFRAVTNSYYAGKLNDQNYFVRIDDNQLFAYSDIYIAKKIVVNIEGGHSVLRKFRMGYIKGNEKYFYEDKSNDNWIFRASLAYRIRL